MTPFDTDINQVGTDVEVAPATPDVDINSLDSFNDVEEVDPNASMTDQIPPPPEGQTYVATVRLVKDGIAEGKRVGAFDDGAVGFFVIKKDGRDDRHLMLVLEIEVQDEGKPWNHQRRREYINTMLDQSRGTTWVDTYLRVLTGSAGVGLSRGQKVQKLHQILQTEPQIKLDLQWALTATEDTPVLDKKTGEPRLKGDGNVRTERKVFLRGMKRFPANPSSLTGHSILTEDPETGAEARTEWVVKNIYPLSHVG
jgi:hypothetical protein